MRVPWLIVGVAIGIAALAVLLPTASDTRGEIQTTLIIGCPLVGLVIGFLLDDWAAYRKRPPEQSPPESP